MQFRIVIISALIFTGLVGGFMLFKNMGTQRDVNTFVVGMSAGYAPFVSINERGDYEGFDIDFANALASALGKKLVLKDLGSMTSLNIALEQDSIDAIIWGMSITQDRLKKFAMVYYQGEAETSYPLLFWKQIPAGITSLSDMKGMTVCVEPTSAQSVVLSNYKNITILPTEKVDDALLSIQYGKAAAVLLDPTIAKKFMKKFPEFKVLDVPLKEDEQVQGMGVMLNRNNTILIGQVQNAVDQLRNNGTLQQYEKKWGME